jgi:hypothetical protein
MGGAFPQHARAGRHGRQRRTVVVSESGGDAERVLDVVVFAAIIAG